MNLKSFSAILIIIILLFSIISCSHRIDIKEEEPDVPIVKFSVPYNENVFILFCIINLIKSDEEILSYIEKFKEDFKNVDPEVIDELIKNYHKMHPLRKKVREDLNSIDPKIIEKIKSNKEFKTFHIAATGRHDLLNYAILQSKEIFLNKNKLLKEFYEEAKIHDLYLKYKDDYEKELEIYKKILPESIKRVRDYLRLENPEEKEIILILNLLESYYTGNYILTPDKIYIYSGPDPDFPQTLIHEYIHTLIKPLLWDNENFELIQQSQELMKPLREKNELIEKGPYNRWMSIVNESLTRSIVDRILFSNEKENMNSRIRLEEKLGFILVRHFCERLEEYEKEDIKFENFLLEMLLTIDVNKEKEEIMKGNK
jgi:hypothetical protein